jgi:hypothetical protein
MTTDTGHRSGSGTTDAYQEGSGAGAGWILFAAIMMITGGFFAIFEGLAALINHGNFYHVASSYPFGTSLTAWGWAFLIGGIVVMLAGFYVMAGAMWARIIGITIASLSALANFFFVPFYPFWSLTVITLDVFVIWALVVHGKALTEV